ncbi:MAG: hypothetical protein WBD18_11695, partial [Phycisphaerae bacterium]
MPTQNIGIFHYENWANVGAMASAAVSSGYMAFGDTGNTFTNLGSSVTTNTKGVLSQFRLYCDGT